jgi:hypothetical protein
MELFLVGQGRSGQLRADGAAFSISCGAYTKQLTPAHPRISDDPVLVRIAYGEKSLGRLARSLGGEWDAGVKLWNIQYGKIKGTELEGHMVEDAK